MGDTCCNLLRHRPERDATQCDSQCCRQLQLLAVRGHRAGSRQPDPLRYLHAYRYDGLQVRHDNDDQVLATIGRAVLGQPFDASFYRP